VGTETTPTERDWLEGLRYEDKFEIERGVTCVVCPGCAFTFDECHDDAEAPGRYTCPCCGKQGLKADEHHSK